jgi:hypothetical protein
LIFEFTRNSTQSGIHAVIPLRREILCDKFVWNGFGPQGEPGGVKYRMYLINPNLGVIISPPGEKCGDR